MQYTCTLIVLFVLSTFLATGQIKYEYSYDNAGNRVKREIIPGVVRKMDEKLTGADSLALTDRSLAGESKSSSEEMGLRTLVGNREVELYPNPTKGYLSISLENHADVNRCEVQITDVNGRQVYRGKPDRDILRIDLSNEPAGTYLINLTVNDRRGYYTVIKE